MWCESLISPRCLRLVWATLISASTSGSRPINVTWRPAVAAACASAVPHSPAPITATRSMAMAEPHVGGIEGPARLGGDVEAIGVAQSQPFGPGPRNHHAVVGAERDRRHHKTRPGVPGGRPQSAAD